MAIPEDELQDAEHRGDTSLDMEVIKCLDSVHQLLCLRDSLSQLLRQGWMEMASARYAMGPARVSQPLFSLKPYAAAVGVAVMVPASSEPANSSADDNEDGSLATSVGLVHLKLQKQRVDAGGDADSQTSRGSILTTEPSSPDSSKALFADWSQEEDAEYRRLMKEIGDSDSVTDSKLSTQAKATTKPLHWFGALVSPHLRAAQGSFQSALEILVDIANAQGEAIHAHAKVMQEGGKVSLIPEAAEATEASGKQ